jgi:hypothetical protein
MGAPGQIQIKYGSLDDAINAMYTLMNKVDGYQVKKEAFFKSTGDSRDQLGLMEDDFDHFKTALGKLIDGTHQAFMETSQAFSKADKGIATKMGAGSNPRSPLLQQDKKTSVDTSPTQTQKTDTDTNTQTTKDGPVSNTTSTSSSGPQTSASASGRVDANGAEGSASAGLTDFSQHGSVSGSLGGN